MGKDAGLVSHIERRNVKKGKIIFKSQLGESSHEKCTHRKKIVLKLSDFYCNTHHFWGIKICILFFDMDFQNNLGWSVSSFLFPWQKRLFVFQTIDAMGIVVIMKRVNPFQNVYQI